MSFELTLLSLASMTFLTLLVGSGYLWVRLLMRVADGCPLLTARFREDKAKVPPFVFALVAVYLGMGLWQKIAPSTSPPPKLDDFLNILYATISEGVMIIFALWISIFTLTQRRTDFYRLGFRFDHLRQQIIDGGLGFLTALVPVFSVLLLTSPLRSVETTHPFLQLLNAQGGAVFVAVFVAAVVVAPIMEELVFRVILQTTLVRWCGPEIGIAITAVLFAAVHPFPDSLGLLPLAFILGYVYHQRRSFLSVVLIHALFNAFNISLLVLQKLAESVPETANILP